MARKSFSNCGYFAQKCFAVCELMEMTDSENSALVSYAGANSSEFRSSVRRGSRSGQVLKG
jgi:hypothetical protein